VAAYAERQCRSDLRTIARLDAELVRWQRSKAEWQARHAEETRKRELVRIVSDEQPVQVPAWFLGYLGEATPPDLLLTGLEVKRTNDVWAVRITGAAQPTTNAAPADLFRAALSEMTNNLASGPFHLNFNLNTFDEKKASPPGRPVVPPLKFEINGLIR
jgi:hypothetical protein